MRRLYRLAALPLLPLIAAGPAQGHRRPEPPARHARHTVGHVAVNAVPQPPAAPPDIRIALPPLDATAALPDAALPGQAAPSPLDAALAVAAPQFVAQPPPPQGSQTAAAPVPVPASAAVPRARIEPAVADGGPAILLRTDRDVGLAAFRSGGDLVIVLDAALDFTPTGGLDPVFAGLGSHYATNSTVLRLPLAASRSLRVARSPAGWLLAATANPVTLNSIRPQLVPTPAGGVMLRMAASQPAGVVSVIDPLGSGVLLVGTQMASGEAVSTGRHDVQFDMPVTLQGVVVAPVSDDIQLRRVENGFEIVAGPHANSTILSGATVQTGPQPTPSPASLLFQIPHDTVAGLTQTLEQQQHAAAEAPALAKSEPRLRMAETMLALGMDVEALSVLDIAFSDDPALSTTPRAAGLHAVAGILAHRPAAADGILDPRLSGPGETQLWRALMHVLWRQDGDADAAQLAATLPILRGYPAPLQARLLPAALQSMALHGQARAAGAVLKALADDASLTLARAMVLEAGQRPADALPLYEQVANRPDRLPRYTAMVRAAELRNRLGQLDAKGSADALERSLYAWREPDFELPERVRIAGLRQQAGQWKQAIEVLQDGHTAYPGDHPELESALATVLNAMLTANAKRGAGWGGVPDAGRTEPRPDRQRGLARKDRPKPGQPPRSGRTGRPGRTDRSAPGRQGAGYRQTHLSGRAAGIPAPDAARSRRRDRGPCPHGARGRCGRARRYGSAADDLRTGRGRTREWRRGPGHAADDRHGGRRRSARRHLCQTARLEARRWRAERRGGQTHHQPRRTDGRAASARRAAGRRRHVGV